MSLLESSQLVVVGFQLIDSDHLEFVALVNQLDSASKADFPALFLQLYQHTEQHFEREQSLMKQLNYPGLADHHAEHQRLLAEFKQFKTRVDKGVIVFAQAFVREQLPKWLLLHVSTMDAALVNHLKAVQACQQ